MDAPADIRGCVVLYSWMYKLIFIDAQSGIRGCAI